MKTLRRGATRSVDRPHIELEDTGYPHGSHVRGSDFDKFVRRWADILTTMLCVSMMVAAEAVSVAYIVAPQLYDWVPLFWSVGITTSACLLSAGLLLALGTVAGLRRLWLWVRERL